MNKKTAIRELKRLADEAPKLLDDEAFSENHTRWMVRVSSVLEAIFGRNSKYYLSFEALPWCKVGNVMIGGAAYPEELYDPRAAMQRINHEEYRKQLMSSRGLLLAAVDEVELTDNMESIYEGKDTAPESSALIRIINLAERGLRKSIREAPENEKVVQDAFETLLIGAGIPYSREALHIEYSSKTYIPDFICERLDLTIEVKLCPTGEREKKIIPEINDDIRAYSTKFGNQVFIVYDTGNIRDVDRFTNDLQDNEGVVVIVVKH